MKRHLFKHFNEIGSAAEYSLLIACIALIIFAAVSMIGDIFTPIFNLVLDVFP